MMVSAYKLEILLLFPGYTANDPLILFHKPFLNNSFHTCLKSPNSDTTM